MYWSHGWKKAKGGQLGNVFEYLKSYYISSKWEMGYIDNYKLSIHIWTNFPFISLMHDC